MVLRQQHHQRRPTTKNIWLLYQILSWLRIPSPAFFVRGAEILPCPCCGERLKIIGSRLRKCIKGSGETIILNIRRLRCVHCKQIHHELPDFVVPYKRYEADCIENVVSALHTTLDTAADECTFYRWRRWFETLAPYLAGCLTSLSIRYSQVSVEPSSVAPPSVLQRIGHFVGDAPRWLARVVRPIANLNLWIHTRSAFLSESS